MNIIARLAAAALLTASALAATVSVADAAPDSVVICHATGADKYVTLKLPYKAVFGKAGHFNENGTPLEGHEDDYLGPCVAPPTTTTSTTTTTSSTTSTTSTTSPPPDDRRQTTTTIVVIDACENLGTCQTTSTTRPPRVSSTTTTSTVVPSSTLAHGGSGTNVALSGIASLLLGLGAFALRLARRPT